MKCPVCGKDIPAGHLYCENCGGEINIVPEFEPEIENSISETLNGVAEEIEEKDTENETDRLDPADVNLMEKRNAVTRISGGITALVMIILISVYMYLNYSTGYQVGKAEKLMKASKYAEATTLLKKAEKRERGNVQITMYLSQCYEQLGESEKAVALLQGSLSKNQLSDEELIKLYEQIIEIYEDQKDYESISKLLIDCGREEIQTSFQYYMALPPVYNYESGNYEDALYLRLSANTTGTIYYTIDGSTPDESSIRYTVPLQLESGRHQINAVFVNDYGIKSEVARNWYAIDYSLVDAPLIIPESGSYNIPTKIECEVPEGYLLYYTMNRSEPDENAMLYTEPIDMPLGACNFKFVLISEDGRKSELAIRSYVFSINSQITTNVAVQRIIGALVDRKVLLNGRGDIPGGGRSRFEYNSVVQIGESYYYIFNEFTTDTAGNEKKEERMYAVEVYQGLPNRLTYDASGQMGLIPLY